jgi:sodium-dependent dicarboxylate transporter 2/3/5
MSQQLLKLLFGPILFGLCLIIGDANEPQLKMLGCLLWMLSWWITNALPVGVTALLPILVFPLLGILDLKSTSANYANPIIYLFFGGFILGLAIEKWNLHKRIALNIINLSGDKPSKIVLGTMLATALLSMWISNTATTVMMLPIGLSVAALLGTKIDDKKSASNFKVSLLLGIAFAANIGGITTLIGTPPNLVLAGLVDEYQLTSISFASWFLFALPLVTILFIIVFTINSMLMYPMRLKKIEGVKTMIKAEISGLGKMQAGEIRIAILMLAAAVLWITRTQLTKIPGLESLSDTAIAILAAISAFIIPSKPKKWNKPLLDWNDTKKLPWGILLLFGGGISIGFQNLSFSIHFY